MKIESIKIKHMSDESPDLSWLGEYTDELYNGVIVRRYDEFYENLDEDMEIPERGREFRFFKPCAGDEKHGTKEYYKYGMQDYKRAEDYNNGYFSLIGIQAEAVVSYPSGNGSRRLEWLTSAGLWGIESDSGDYLDEVTKDELEDLKRHLEHFGVNTDNFYQIDIEYPV